MGIARLGRKGQISIPKAVLKQAGITGETTMLVDLTPDGAIQLREAGVYPLEIYSAERVREFEEGDRLTAEESAKLKRRLAKLRRHR